jgi:hypothetical protein
MGEEVCPSASRHADLVDRLFRLHVRDGVDDFEQVWPVFVRVKFWPGHELSRREKLSVALGKVDLYVAPAYLHTWYHTDDRKLIDVLRRYRLIYGR